MQSDRFGSFGGRYVPETLIGALDEVAVAYAEASDDESFQDELKRLNLSLIHISEPTRPY